ncbi:hypothetical protein NHX12_010963 [Muraenolepis orangiensis]|uniref:Uncharacterized protein n=1 Tax=Muraenolepis orangiensis TaxID=630683 RepID=A0A9Q0I6Q1_9TELE|nr:hypothetical protein NHX12_010963 [Muraenolepis orangiensis]
MTNRFFPPGNADLPPCSSSSSSSDGDYEEDQHYHATSWESVDLWARPQVADALQRITDRLLRREWPASHGSAPWEEAPPPASKATTEYHPLWFKTHYTWNEFVQKRCA